MVGKTFPLTSHQNLTVLAGPCCRHEVELPNSGMVRALALPKALFPSLRAFIPLHLQLSLSKLPNNMLASGPATPALVARAITLAENHVRLRPGKY